MGNIMSRYAIYGYTIIQIKMKLIIVARDRYANLAYTLIYTSFIRVLFHHFVTFKLLYF